MCLSSLCQCRKGAPEEKAVNRIEEAEAEAIESTNKSKELRIRPSSYVSGVANKMRR